MELPVQNIVAEIELKSKDVLLPLFECVVNSIISLKKKNGNGEKKIQIQIERGELPKNTEIFERTKTIKEITIIDNGIGFNDDNYKSFKTPYSRLNREHGCKGVGRFTVLAAFEEIQIDSHFKDSNEVKRRSFIFNPSDEIKEIKNGNLETKLKDEKTIVKLVNLYQPNLIEASAIPLDEIGERLLNHCLIYYLSGDLPEIEIFDKEDNVALNLNDLFEKLSKDKEREFKIEDYKFHCYITKSERTSNRKHNYSYFCANSRVVGAGKKLSKVSSLFLYPITENGNTYFLDVYLVSDYLNKKVYRSRNGFSIPHENEKSLFDKDDITYEEIEFKLAEILQEEYDTFVKETQQRNVEDVKNFIQTKAPEYRRFANRQDILDSIPPNLSDEKKDEFLHKVAYQERKNIEKSIQEFIEQKEVNQDTILAIKKKLIEQTAYDTDNLADYMFKRKAIIDIFKKFLEADQNGSYKLEEDIHNLIFPMGLTQANVNYDSHNLWLLDERFATYSFIASDKPITSISQKKSRKEPDLVLMDDNPQMFSNPISFASNPSGEIQSMVIFEFKRPGETAHQKAKTDYRWEFSELIDKYFDEFLYGQDKKNYKGRPVIIRKETPKYGYVIVDVIPPMLEEYNIGKGYRKTPFGTFYKIYPELNMHIEVITFEQLIKAVETRHAPFFDKLFT